MAAVTHLHSTQLTTNLSAYTTTPTFAPAVGDLLVVFAAVTASVSAAPTLTESAGGGTYTLQSPRALKGTSADALYCFVRNTLCEDTTARTLTWTSVATDAATTFGCVVAKVTGMEFAGTRAVRQIDNTDNGSGATPVTVYPAVTEIWNPNIGCVFHTANPAAIGPPAGGWVELVDTGIGTPNAGMEYASIDSGHASATITWGSVAGSTFCALSVELDANRRPPALTMSQRLP